MKKYLGLRGPKLQIAIGVIAGLDFLLFGYDQGVMGGLLTLDVFKTQFPRIDPTSGDGSEKSRHSTYQGITVASYTLGCFFGAVTTIWIGNMLGRRRAIFLGSSIMVVGAILQCTSFQLAQLIVGRLITGFGNGINTSTVPTWQSETSRSHKRGQLVMIEGALITGGICISYWIDLGLSFAPGSIAWRFPIAFQIVFALIILGFVMLLPESPRWLILKGDYQEAQDVLSALDDAPVEDEYVQDEYIAIKATVEEMSKGSFRDLFTMDKNRHFHRVVLAYTNQMFQQISGINIITYYAATIFSGIGLSGFLSRLLAACNGTEYFLASWIAVFIIEKVGRRKLMLFGAAGQSLSMVILAITDALSVTHKSAGLGSAVMLFVFNTFFAIGWLGMTWLYPAEIVPLRIRAPANAVATSANWLFNFLVVMITPVCFANITYNTYTIFAIINAFIIPCVYFFYPETAYRSLEEMDTIFHRTTSYFDVVYRAKQVPRRYDQHGKLLLKVDEVERNISSAAGGNKGGRKDVWEADAEKEKK